jgi:hypothetical protein
MASGRCTTCFNRPPKVEVSIFPDGPEASANIGYATEVVIGRPVFLQSLPGPVDSCGLDDGHGTVDNPGSRTESTSTLARPVATPADAGVVTFDVASRGSRLAAFNFAGMTTDAPMVIAAIVTAVTPKTARRIEVS